MTQKPLKILQASAGSGKTFSLTAHYLTLLFAGDTRYREILAVTFTNKATEEMKSRILEVLKGLAQGEQGVETFRQIILRAHAGLDKDSLRIKADHIYRRILHDYSRFAINTIDGFVQKVIRSLSFELGLDAGYKLKMNTGKVKQELADKLNKKLDINPDLLEWIISLALDRIRDNKSWNYRDTLLSLAGEIFKERYHPFENALKEHDSKQLFKDLQEVTKQMISFVEDSLLEKAAFALRVFKQSGIELAELKGKSRSPLCNLEKVSDGDFSKIISLSKLVDDQEEWQKGSLSPSVSSLYDSLNPLLAEIRDFYIERLPAYEMSKAISVNLYYLRLMQEMAGLLKDYRQENSALLISDAQNLLKGITGSNQDNPSFVWEKLGSRFRHFLFDEFQDTSAMQWDNFMPLVQNAISEHNGNLIDHLIVGDVKQSIYRWRNGDWQILLQRAKADIGTLSVLDDSLAENYRSAANIIDFNNFLFKHSPAMLQESLNHKVKAEGGEELFQNWWQKNGLDDIIVKAYEQSIQQKSPGTAKGGSIQVNYLPVANNKYRSSQCREQTLEHLAETINEWISSGRYKAGEICVLVRSNKEARSVIEHLMQDQQSRQNDPDQLGLWKPYQVLSGEALLLVNNSAVRLLVNTFKAMVANRDQSALYKLNILQLYARFRRKEVDPEILLQLNSKEIVNLTGHLPGSLCENWFQWQQLPLTELVELLIGAYGLDRSELHLPYLLAFRDMISSFSKTGEKGINSFLVWWKEESAQKALPSSGQGDAVQVMTIHKSKGLAFDVVMIPFCSWDIDGMTNSIFWVETADTPYAMLKAAPVNYKKSLGQSAFAPAYFKELLFNYMDALNMLYVATTRTRKHLYISSPGHAEAKTDQFDMAGDLIRVPLQTFVSELNAEFDGQTLLIDEPVEKISKPEVEEQAGRFTSVSWNFESYPLSGRLNEALTDKKVFEKLDLLSGNSSQRRGILLHEVLSRANNAGELAGALKQMLTEGLFRQAEEAGLLELAQSVLTNPELKEILDRPHTSYNERTIISSNGESYRPDKVLIGQDSVVVIDFKFTGKPSMSHYKQVDEYRDLLSEMGYTNIEAYLYYGYLKELISVSKTENYI